MRSLTYYVAASADGYIAGPDGQFDFFGFDSDLAAWIIEEYPETLPVHAREALGIADVDNRRFDTVVMGRLTYQPALDAGILSPYPHLHQVVFSTTLSPGSNGVEVTGTDPLAHVRELKDSDGAGGIWLAGGGRLAAALRYEIDELVIKRNPIVLGAGIPLVAGSFAPNRSTGPAHEPSTPEWSSRSTAEPGETAPRQTRQVAKVAAPSPVVG